MTKPVTGSISIAPASVVTRTVADAIAEHERARSSQDPALANSLFLPGNLGVGTRLTYAGRTSVIRGVFSFDFQGVLWQDYLAEDPSGRWWRFGVEPDLDFRLAAYDPYPITAPPGPEHLHFADDFYSLTRSGRANYRAAGITDTFEDGRYWYYDYQAANGRLISFERFDEGPWRTSIGEFVSPRSVAIDNALDAN